MNVASNQDNERPAPLFHGYAGPSLWAVVGNHFGPRLSEWALSVTMMVHGFILLSNDKVWSNPQFVYFLEVFGTPILLGIACFLFGFLGLIGLTVNGYRKEVTPWVRFARAAVGFMVFTGMTTCFLLSGQLTLWVAWYPVAVACELVNMFRTSKDAGESYVPRSQ